jgi:hypothetical protein
LLMQISKILFTPKIKIMKTTHNLFILLIMSSLFLSCKNTDDGEKESEAVAKDVSSNLNISILIDLSDRISPQKYPNQTMEYYLRDVGYINSIAEAFTDHIQTKKVRQADDRIQLFFDPTPYNPEINSISKDLKIEIDRNNISKDIIKTVNQKYSSKPLELYELAIKDDNYVGSDTWKFFKNKVNDYCIDDNYRNILIVLTDGYIYFNDSKIKEGNSTAYLSPEVIRSNGLNTSDWSEKMITQKMEFIKANNDLSNLEILVLGINPDTKNPYEDEVIKAYWTKWFEAMKVKRYEIHTSELPSNMDKIIKDFINKK